MERLAISTTQLVGFYVKWRVLPNHRDSYDLQRSNYIEALTSVYSNFLSGKINFFYLVTNAFSILFISSPDKNPKNIKKEAYVGNYFKRIESDIQSLNISFTKSTNKKLQSLLENKASNKVKEVPLDFLKCKNEGELIEFFNDRDEFNVSEDSNISLLNIVGVNMTMLFNYILNENVNEVYIYSPHQFLQGKYMESKLLITEGIEYDISLKLYGCLFSSAF